MTRENDLIPGDEPAVDGIGPIDIIENSIMLINECREWTTDDYDAMGEDKVKVMSMAFKLIHKAQRKLLSQI